MEGPEADELFRAIRQIDNTKRDQSSDPTQSQQNAQSQSKEKATHDEEMRSKVRERPVSFSSNVFVDPDREMAKKSAVDQSEYLLKEKIKDYSLETQTKPSLFATFAISSQTQNELPYFKEVEFADIIDPPKAQEEDPNIKASSYSSNFLTVSQPDWQKDSPIRCVNSQNPIKKQHISLLFKTEKEPAQEEQVNHVAKGKMMQSEGLLHVSKTKYQQITFKISEDLFSIQNVPIQIKLIAKVKIYPAEDPLPNYNLLKVSTKGVREQLLIALKKSVKYIEFPLPYFTLAKLVIKKLKYLGVSNITQWELPERQPSSFFVKKKYNKSIEPSSKSSNKEKKVTDKQKSKQKPKKQDTSGQRSKQIICQANTYVHGKIFKKSRHLGRWQKRYITINELGIFSYKSADHETASVRIDRKNIKYIWTWFSLLLQQNSPTRNQREQEFEGRVFEYQETQLISILKSSSVKQYNKYLIIKIKHGYSEQTQFAIPICNFDTDPKNKNWLFGFFKVLPSLQKNQ